MVALVVVLIGLALIFSQRDFAKSLVRPLFGLILIVLFAPALLTTCGRACAPSAGGGTTAIGPPPPLFVAAFIVGTIVALYLYVRRRLGHAKRRDEQVRERERARSRGREPVPPRGDW